MTFLEKLSGINDLDNIRCYWIKTHKYLISLSLEERKKERSRIHNEFLTRFQNQIPAIKELLEETARSLLGSSLVAPNNKKYKISMLEIYADGIWDEAGDYIKEIFLYQKTRAIEKMMAGPMLYYHGGRIDIKVFSNYLPFSFLIRKLHGNESEQYFHKDEGSAYPREKLDSSLKPYENLFGLEPGYFKRRPSCNELIKYSSPDYPMMLNPKNKIWLAGPFESIPESDIKYQSRIGLINDEIGHRWRLSINQ